MFDITVRAKEVVMWFADFSFQQNITMIFGECLKCKELGLIHSYGLNQSN